VAVILFTKSGVSIPPISLNLFKNTIGIILLTLTMLICGTPLIGEASFDEYIILMLSGIIGIAIADTLFFISLNMLGASITAIVDCLYSPLVVYFAYIMLGEKMSFWDYIGASFIVSAIAILTGLPKANGINRKNLVKGIVICTIAMACMAFAINFAKPVIDRTPILWSSTVRLLGGNIALALVTLILPSRKNTWSVLIPQRAWRVSMPAALIGGYLAMILWIAGMKLTKVSIAGILNQLSTIFIVILAYLFLKEPLSKRKIAAVLLAITGALLVILA